MAALAITLAVVTAGLALAARTGFQVHGTLVFSTASSRQAQADAAVQRKMTLAAARDSHKAAPARKRPLPAGKPA